MRAPLARGLCVSCCLQRAGYPEHSSCRNRVRFGRLDLGVFKRSSPYSSMVFEAEDPVKALTDQARACTLSTAGWDSAAAMMTARGMLWLNIGDALGELLTGMPPSLRVMQ